MLKFLSSGVIAGCRTPDCGHTFLVRANGWIYSLRSLAEGSFLCLHEEASGRLIGEYPTEGQHSCHICILPKQAVVCDYTSGTLSLFTLDGKGIPTGDVQLVKFSPTSHIHCSTVSPDGKFLTVTDLGTDKLYRFGVDDGLVSTDSKEIFPTPSGSGPRHCVFGEDGSRLYVSTELSDEVLVYSYPQMELLQRNEVNPLHPGGGGHIAIGTGGHFIYVSSRLKGDGIATFAIIENGLLEKRGYVNTGEHPRHFALSADGLGLFVACRDSGVRGKTMCLSRCSEA